MTRDEFERDLFEVARHDCMSLGRAEIIRDQVRALLAATRAEALEDAAQVCDRFGVEWRLYAHVTESVAGRIRALVKP